MSQGTVTMPARVMRATFRFTRSTLAVACGLPAAVAVSAAAGSGTDAVVCAPGAPLDTSIFSAATEQATTVNDLAWLVFGIAILIFVVVEALIIWCVVRYRRRDRGEGEPAQVYGSGPIELAWTVVPMVIVFVLFLVSARAIHELERTEPPENSFEVTVVGHQWWWEFRYPELGIVTANELHLPASPREGPERPVALTLRSADVIHSFWVPRLAGKTDVVPNHPNLMWFVPTEPGVYWGQCAEYCGTQHANMRIRVVVHEQDDFDAWAAGQQAEATRVERVKAGREMFLSLSCVSCHTVSGTGADGTFGPDLSHLMSRERIGAGVAMNNRENLMTWVADPDTLKPGSNMPAMKLDDQELELVVEYLLTLGPQHAPRSAVEETE